MVCWMWLLKTAHLLRLWPLAPVAVLWFVSNCPEAGLWTAAICAMFRLKRSLSILMIFSFFFIAPGLLFKLRCFIRAMPVSVTWSFRGGASGKAAARDSRLATSFFDGRLRFLGWALDFSMREIRAERLMIRLSFFVVLKAFWALRCVCRIGFAEVELVLEGCARMAERLPAVGACEQWAKPSSRYAAHRTYHGLFWLDHEAATVCQVRRINERVPH